MQAQLQTKGVDGALFIFPIDVFYFSGTRQNSTLWIPAAGEPILMVRKSLSRAKGRERVDRYQAVSVKQGISRAVRQKRCRRSVLPLMSLRCSSLTTTQNCCRGANLSTSPQRIAKSVRSSRRMSLNRLRKSGSDASARFLRRCRSF